MVVLEYTKWMGQIGFNRYHIEADDFSGIYNQTVLLLQLGHINMMVVMELILVM